MWNEKARRCGRVVGSGEESSGMDATAAACGAKDARAKEATRGEEKTGPAGSPILITEYKLAIGYTRPKILHSGVNKVAFPPFPAITHSRGNFV